MMTCPRCDGQGSVLKVEILETKETLFVCDECEATWFEADNITATNWVDFGTVLEQRGLKPEWSEVRIIGEAA